MTKILIEVYRGIVVSATTDEKDLDVIVHDQDILGANDVYPLQAVSYDPNITEYIESLKKRTTGKEKP